MSIKTIPIRAAIDRSRESKTKKRLQEKEFDGHIKAKIEKCSEESLKRAKENLSFLNKLIKEEPLKSYLKTTYQFPLWEGGPYSSYAFIYLRSDGVYAGDNLLLDTYKKVTHSSLIMDARGYLSFLPYIWSLVRWNREAVIEYLRKQFTPII